MMTVNKFFACHTPCLHVPHHKSQQMSLPAKFIIRRTSNGMNFGPMWSAFESKDFQFELSFVFMDLAQFVKNIPDSSIVDTKSLTNPELEQFYQAASGKQLKYCDLQRGAFGNALWVGSLTELESIKLEMEIYYHNIKYFINLAEIVPKLEIVYDVDAMFYIYLIRCLKDARPVKKILILHWQFDLGEISPYHEFFYEKLYQELETGFPFSELVLSEPPGIEQCEMSMFANILNKLQSNLTVIWLECHLMTCAFSSGAGGIIVFCNTLRDYDDWKEIYNLRLQLCRNSIADFHRLPAELRRSLQDFLA